MEAGGRAVIDASKVNNALTLSGDIDALSYGLSNLKSNFATVTVTNLSEYGGDSEAGDTGVEGQ